LYLALALLFNSELRKYKRVAGIQHAYNRLTLESGSTGQLVPLHCSRYQLQKVLVSQLAQVQQQLG
jgi:hypothetical protein